MPIQNCSENGSPGYRWGDAGKCYTYSRGNEASRKAARKKALAQGIAIGDIEVSKGYGIETLYLADYPLEDTINIYRLDEGV